MTSNGQALDNFYNWKEKQNVCNNAKNGKTHNERLEVCQSATSNIIKKANKPVSQSYAQWLRLKHSDGPLDIQTWQTEWKTVPLAKVQLCEYENKTLEAFAAARCLYAKFDCSVARQKFSLLATAHDCETGL